MIVAKIIPSSVVMRRAGAIPVAAVNPIDPTHGLVPFRTNGAVADMMMDYTRPDRSSFHRYVGVSLVGSFEKAASASAAIPAAERSLRMHPGPGIYFESPIDEKGRDGFIWVHAVGATGWVHSKWDPVSRSVINETLRWHMFRKGFVARQASAVGRNVYVTTFGEGVNGDEVRAWLNGTLGFGGFKGLDSLVFIQMMGCEGLMSAPLPIADSVNNAYIDLTPPTELMQ